MKKDTARPFANIYWFPVAALYAAIILPWSVLAMLGMVYAPAGLQGSWGHGHEMIFGFALAVIAGYTLGPQSKSYILLIILTWLSARLSFLFFSFSLLSGTLNLAFVSLLLWKILPVFWRAIQRWRNGAVGVVIIGLALLLFVVHVLYALDELFTLHKVLFEAILFLSALMFFMGGRMIGPAIMVHLKTQNISLKDSIQSDLEGYVLIILAIALILNLLPWPMTQQITGLLFIACAAIALLRLYRWQAWRCYTRADIIALLSGYLWIIGGWCAIAFTQITQQVPMTIAFHTITVGALGTLTFTVMARGRMHKRLGHPNRYAWVFACVLLIAVAALLRISILWFSPIQALVISACLWAVAFAVLFFLQIYLTVKEH